MGDVIDLFNNKRVDDWFFRQFTHIQAALVKNNRLYVRMGVVPIQRRRPEKRDIFDFRSQDPGNQPKLAIPPSDWLKKLRCDLWDPENGFRSQACFEQAEPENRFLLLTSAKLNLCVGEELSFSIKTKLMINGPAGQSYLVDFKDVDVRRVQRK